MTKILAGICTAVPAGYVIVLAALTLFQRRLLYLPHRARPALPAELAGVEALTLRTEDGLDLLAWHLPAAGAGGPVVLYLHGNGGSIGSRAWRLALMRAQGWGALMPEFRGYGGNPGKPSERGLVLDARAGLAALLRMGVAPSRIVIWGESLGTGLAARLAAESTVGAVVLESPYPNITAMAQRRFPFIPVGWLLWDRFETLGRIGHVRAPLLVLAGAHDTLIPAALSQAVVEAATAPKQFWVAPLAGHANILPAGGWEVAVTFVGRQVPAPVQPPR